VPLTVSWTVNSFVCHLTRVRGPYGRLNYCAHDVCFAPAFQMQIVRAILIWKTREHARGRTEGRLVIEGGLCKGKKSNLISSLICEMFIAFSFIYSSWKKKNINRETFLI
jgi:hypothetical protein